jgi:PST family polysaccharide transporter
MTSGSDAAPGAADVPAPARRVARNVLWLALEPTLRLLLAVPLAGFVARKLGVIGYGQFNLALALAMLMGVLANLGLNEVLQREVARQPGDLSRLWSSVLAVKTVLFCLYVAVLFVVGWASGYGLPLLAAIPLMGAYQGLISLDNGVRAVFSGRQEMKPLARLDFVKVLAEVGLTVTVLLLGAGVVGLSAARAGLVLMGLFITAFLAHRRFRIRLSTPDLRLVRPMLAPALSFAGIAAVRMINARAGVLLLERARGVEAVALFTAALMPVERIFLFLPAVESALYPFFSAMRHEQADWFASALVRAVRYQAVLAAGLGLAVGLLGPPVLSLIFPSEFAGAGAILEVLGISVAMRSLSGVLITAMAARGLERHVAGIIATQSAINVAAALALTHSLGARGLAWATVAAEAVTLLLALIVLRRRGALGPLAPSSLLWPFLTASILWAAFALVPSARAHPAWAVPLCAAYPLLLLLTGILSRTDIDYLYSTLRGAEAARARRPAPGD